VATNESDIQPKKHKYREFAERESAMIESFADRLSQVEANSAGVRSDIKSLFSSVEKMTYQLDRMMDRTRPNTLALFGAMISLVSLIAVIGVLAFAPVYRAMDEIKTSDITMENSIDAINANRYTPEDARRLEQRIETEHLRLEETISKRMYRNEEILKDLLDRTSRLEGYESGEKFSEH
jgi:hypothetical protein